MKKILILDNLKASVEEKKQILSGCDCTILTAASDDEAMHVHRKEKVDLIVRDLDIPGMTGEGFCSQIREDYGLKKVSIIIICSAREADMRRREGGRANAYIKKPINPPELLQKAGELLNISSRLNIRVIAKIEVKGKDKSEFISHSKNISASGMLLETDKILEKGDLVSCNFFLGPEQVTTDGKIARMVKKRPNLYQYGIKFVDIDLLSKAKIVKYVNKP